MIQKLLITLAVCFAGVNSAPAGTIDPNTPDSKHVEYGKEFHCVGKFCGLDKNGKLGVGSCVAIRPKVVLTAAHVVQDVVSSHVHVNGKEFTVAKTVVRDGFDFRGKLGNDIAICLLTEDMGLDFYPQLYEKTDEIGRIVSISGYGLHGTFLTGGVKSDDKRRGGSNVIDSVLEDLLIATPGKTRRTALEFCITPGDSGGGMFLDNKVVGINTCVFHNKNDNEALGKYGHEAAHTRISRHKSWIDEVVALHESGFHGNEFIVDAEKPAAE